MHRPIGYSNYELHISGIQPRQSPCMVSSCRLMSPNSDARKSPKIKDTDSKNISKRTLFYYGVLLRVKGLRP